MRVLSVGNMYPPHHAGGYELVWRSAMQHLVASGDPVRVLTTDHDTGAREPDDAHVYRELRWYWRDHGFPPLGRRERLRLERANSKVLRRHIEDFSPDVVSWWSMGGMSLSLLEAVRRRKLPAVAFVHDDWLDYGRSADGWTKAFRSRSRLVGDCVAQITGVPTRVDLNRVARYVFVSETTRSRASAAGIVPEWTDVAHSGIDPTLLEPIVERRWDWNLLYVGRLDERKGVATCIEALPALPQARLSVVGGWDESEAERLRRHATDTGVASRVEFLGQRSRDEVREAYDKADAVIFPVIWEEPWGLVPIEAMARGRAVVATGHGGSSEYLRDGENALLFPAGDSGRLAHALERLAADPALREHLRAGGRATARLHTEAHFNRAVRDHLVRAVQDWR